jgi:two-component system, OmpR family, heavy metal sensor histidine kinase CusS
MFSKSATEEAGPPAPESSSLAVSLSVWCAAACFGISVAALAVLYGMLVFDLNRAGDERLIRATREARQVVASPSADLVLREPAVGARIVDAAGRTVASTRGVPDAVLAAGLLDPVPEGVEPRRAVRVKTPDGRFWRMIAARAANGLVVQTVLDVTEQAEVLAGYRTRLWMACVWVLAGSILAGYIVGRLGVAPVAEMTRTALRIRSTSTYERISTSGLPLELAALADRFNELLDRFDESFTRLSRFASEIAHELRTPVNNLRGEAEVALGKARTSEEYREVLSSCLEECQRLSGTIDSLLFLARMESPDVELKRTPVELDKELDAVREYYEAAAEDAGVTLEAIAGGSLRIGVDRRLFQQALGNLVANAIAYTPKGGKVTVSAADAPDLVRVSVADTGRGIAPKDLAHVFERFYRGDQARNVRPGGSGLGLAIVKTIMSLHGGTVEVSSRVGQGTQIDLNFPKSVPAR